MSNASEVMIVTLIAAVLCPLPLLSQQCMICDCSDVPGPTSTGNVSPDCISPTKMKSRLESKRQLQNRLSQLQNQAEHLLVLASDLRQATLQGGAKQDLANQAKKMEKLSRTVGQLLVPSGTPSPRNATKGTPLAENSLGKKAEYLLRSCTDLKQRIEANKDGHIDLAALQLALSISAEAKIFQRAANQTGP